VENVALEMGTVMFVRSYLNGCCDGVCRVWLQSYGTFARRQLAYGVLWEWDSLHEQLDLANMSVSRVICL